MRSEITVPCRCGRTVAAEVPSIVDIRARPQARQELLTRCLHAGVCPSCSSMVTLEHPFLYLDEDRKQFLGVFPASERGHADSCARAFLDMYHRAFAKGATDFAAERGSYLARICIGLEELREKVVIDEASLFDLSVEVLKGDLLLTERGFQRQQVLTFLLNRVDPGGDLVFWPARADRGFDGTEVIVRREVYDAYVQPVEALRRLRPGIARGPHVSLLRLSTLEASGGKGGSA